MTEVASDHLSAEIRTHENAVGTEGSIWVSDHRIPYIDLSVWPEEHRKRPDQFADTAPELQTAINNGERILNLTLDGRFGLTVPESEAQRWAWFLANAMAVSAGYTSHGNGSRRLNRHGTSVR